MNIAIYFYLYSTGKVLALHRRGCSSLPLPH